jgi:hypothetical protein
MILFKQRFIDQILSGEKTSTRRVGKKRWNVGSIHQFKTSYYSKTFASAEIKSVRREKLGDISLADARSEGFGSPDEFVQSFADIHKTEVSAELAQADVWVIDFVLTDL